MSEPAPLPPARPVPLGEARAEAARLLGRLERCESALRLAVAGATRRMAPWVERLDLLATAHEAEPVLEALASAPRVAAVLERGPRSVRVRLAGGLEARLEVLLDDAQAVPALVRATGPAQHVALLEARAQAVGLAWEAHALSRSGEPLVLFEEADLYAALGLEPIPPELRDSLAPGAAVEGLLAMADVRGAAALHAKPGRGRYPLGDMAARAEREGYAWSLLCVPAHDAEARLAAERALTAWNDAPETRAPGRLLLDVGASLDVAVPASDAALRLGRVALETPGDLERAAAGLANVEALCLEVGDAAAGAPARPDLAAGLAALLAALAARQVALAVPPPPRHPRPEPDLLAAALARGVPLLLLADAHDLVGVDDLVLSVGLARRAGARADQVLNTRSLAELDAWCAGRRRA